jgi:cell fate regulator YaaT (PSP1 superfamily)
MSEFIPVSIKMAKEQNLSLNPTKISGACGRLMCCLKNEQETYEFLNSKMPNVGDVVTTADGVKGVVSSMNVLRQRVKILVDVDKDEKELQEYPVDQLTFKQGKRKGKNQEKNQDKNREAEGTAKELAALEEHEGSKID